MEEKLVETKKEKILDLAAKIGMSTLFAAILFFVISFLYIPSVSYGIYQKASFSGLTGVDSSLNSNDLLITEKRDFSNSQGDVIVFNLKGYGGNDGLKAYRVYSVIDDGITGSKYCLVGSTDSTISYPWRVTEEMYLGTVTVRIPGLGAITGFFASPLSIIFWIVAVGSTVGIVLIVKKKDPTNAIEGEKKKESKK